MVRLSQPDFDMVLITLPAALRRTLTEDAQVNGKTVQFGDDVAGDVYHQIMEYITLNETDREYALTARGHELDIIAMSIFDQSGG